MLPKIKNNHFARSISFDASTKEDVTILRQLADHDWRSFYAAFNNLCSVEQFLVTGKKRLTLGEHAFVLVEDNHPNYSYVVCDNIIYEFNLNSILNDDEYVATSRTVLGVVLTNSILLNADLDDGQDRVATLSHLNRPSIHFQWLQRFYDKDTIEDVAKRIASQEIAIVDYVVEVDDSSTILLFDKTRNVTMLFGMDEDTYFGVELQNHPTTIPQAYRILKPAECRNVQGVKKQGEWFAKPIKETNVPSVPQCDITFGEHDTLNWNELKGYLGVALSRQTEDSIRYCIQCEDGRLCNRVVYALNPILTQELDIPKQLELKGWYAFYHNTAKRSLWAEHKMR